MAEKNTKKELFTKVLFILGIIILMFIFAFTLIKFVPKMFSGFASVGQFISSPFSSNSIKISSNKTSLNSGEKFILNWKYEPKKDGDYNISYTCQENLSIQITSNSGPKTLLCGTQYNIKDIKSAELAVVLKKQNTFADFPVKIEYIDSENKSVLASGEINLSVKNETTIAGNTVIVSEPLNIDSVNSTDSVYQKPISQINYGLTDLALTNVYRLNNNVITFTVSNVGGKESGVWYFNYISPNGHVESSPMQISLSHGQAIKYTLNLDGNYSNGSVKIIVDPQNNIIESNKINNSDSIILGNSTNYYNNSANYNNNDNADLEITNLEVGRISSSNRFTEDDQINVDEDAAVRFTVKNVGGESTGSWKYKITGLPYDNTETKTSNYQTSLKPGQSREITVTFANPDEGRYTIRVKLDSNNDVDEEDESNNSDSIKLTVVN